jgi:hypothetical protein
VSSSLGGYKKRPPTTGIAVVSLKIMVAESWRWRQNSGMTAGHWRWEKRHSYSPSNKNSIRFVIALVNIRFNALKVATGKDPTFQP